MSYKRLFTLLAILLTGCGSMPKTPDLLVQNAKDGKMLSDKDVFEVKRPLSQVTAVLKEKSAECLQRNVETSWWQNGTRRQQIITLTPKIVLSKDHTQLTLQTKHTEAGTFNAGGMPPDGWYMMVVNAYSTDNRTTRIESYYQESSFKGAFTAIKPWVTGANSGCPDLTQ